MTINRTLYVILDSARLKDGNRIKAMELNSEHISLYRGRSEEKLAHVAPYVFSFPYSVDFGNFIMKQGWGNSWGLFVFTDKNIVEVQKHFRKFLIVKTDEGRELYFRFYDPRVLRTFFPTCSEEQLKEFFGPIKMFLMEDKDPAYAIVYRLDEENRLVTNRISIEEAKMKLAIDTLLPNGKPVETVTITNVMLPAINSKKMGRWGAF